MKISFKIAKKGYIFKSLYKMIILKYDNNNSK